MLPWGCRQGQRRYRRSSIGGILIILDGMSNSDRQSRLEERVIRAAESALSRQQYVSAIDVFCGMGLLLPMHVDSWRKGRVDCLERVIQGNLHKISSAMEILRRWLGKGPEAK